MKPPRVMCIAGGSGAGKTTLAQGIEAALHGTVSILHLDDYQKTKEHVPVTTSGRRNYDHPDAVDFFRFTGDLLALRAGRDVTVTRREKRKTMDAGVREGTAVVVPARPLVIVEGYLALWHPDALAQYDLKIFLDAPHALRLDRRLWAKDPQYVEEVLKPMHETFIEPTKRFADLVIDVTNLSRADVQTLAFREIDARKLL
ncbi:MAG TPA: zeta toxin family protein [Candidatus Eisenbacteria bacterium]|nr:zeta toxin family protein [Candidatus Eisenbacteria bacterium]